MNRLNLYLSFILTFIHFCSKGNILQSNIAQDTIPKTTSKITNRMIDKEFIAKLTELGYFDFTEKDKLQIVQDSLASRFNNNKVFFTECDRNPPFHFYDSRFYSCGDGEELYEEGGVISLIKEMQPLLSKIGVQLNYSNDSYVNNYHSIVVNGTTYVLAQGSPLMWGETIQRYAEMVNAELVRNNSKEQLYLLTNENEYMVFMTTEQYNLVCECFSPDKRPLTVSDWTTKTLNELYNSMSR